MNNPISGITYFLDGFRLISKPGLRRFVVIPLIINIIMFAVLFFVMRRYVNEFNYWFVNFLPAWLHWLSVILWFLFIISFFLIFVYTFVTVTNLLCAPFNSFLAEKVELYLTGKIQEPRTLYENMKDIPRIVGRQLCILGYYLPRAFIILILFFVPVVQGVAAIIWFIFHAWFMTMTYIDYPTDNQRVAMRDVRIWMKKKRWVSIGFGMSVLIATMIPVINFFTIPAAVAAATKLWLREQNQQS